MSADIETIRPEIMRLETTRLENAAQRAAALAVVRAVYLEEKAWIDRLEEEIPLGDLEPGSRFSWFVASLGGHPAGLIRLQYDPPLEIPAELEPAFEKELDLAALARDCRFAEIGRFMIVPAYRRSISVALRVMQAAVREAVLAGVTHFVTDVFEDDPHSPLQFHTRVLGFERIGTHRYGELRCASRRIILVLDLAAAYRRLKVRDNKVFRELAADLAEVFEARTEMAATA